MKKLQVIAVVPALFALAYLLLGNYRTWSLRGRLKAVSVTMKYFASTTTNSEGLNIGEKTITIHDRADLAMIEKSLRSVRNHSGANSGEGLPTYRMQVQYTDGSTQQFIFTRREWSGSGFTPPSLLEILQLNGL